MGKRPYFRKPIDTHMGDLMGIVAAGGPPVKENN